MDRKYEEQRSLRHVKEASIPDDQHHAPLQSAELLSLEVLQLQTIVLHAIMRHYAFQQKSNL